MADGVLEEATEMCRLFFSLQEALQTLQDLLQREGR
jgi:hypothetical protein